MFEGIALALLLCAPTASLDAHRAELDDLAGRIQQLKLRQLHGDNVRRELERLLVRAQELAGAIEAELDRGGALPIALPPSPDELRERADAARDEADRLAAEIAALDVRIQDGRRLAGDSGVARAALTTGVAAHPADRLRVLQAERAALSARRARAEAEAARLDAEARDAEQVR